MQLDAVGDWHASPARGDVFVTRLPPRLDRRAEGRGKRRRDATLQGVSRDVLHLALDDVERDPLALTNLDREELEEVAIVVRSRGTRAFWPLEQSVRDDSPASRDDALVAMREAVRAALGREDIR